MKRLLAALALGPFAVGAAIATVNVNTAQQSELERTRGLDKHKAKAIIEYRAANGPFDSLDDLEKVPGLTPELVAKLEPQVAFEGAPYVPTKPAPKAKKK